jgi:ketosteroid isomerase-like protein
MTTLDAGAMKALLRRYYAACDSGDAAAIAACFTPDAVHYFPATPRYGPWRGAAAIAAGWAETVRRTGAVWTIDRMVVDADEAVAVVEWTQFRPRHGKRLRGDEWYAFDRASGRIAEVRAYFAATEHDGQAVHELGGFDYAGRGYPVAPPRR